MRLERYITHVISLKLNLLKHSPSNLSGQMVGINFVVRALNQSTYKQICFLKEAKDIQICFSARLVRRIFSNSIH